MTANVRSVVRAPVVTPTSDGWTDTSYIENLVTFDGTNDWLARFADYDGSSDGRRQLLFISVVFANAATVDEYILAANGTSAGSVHRVGATGRIQVQWRIPAGTQNINLTGTTAIGAERCNILASIDADGTSYLYLWTDTAGAWFQDASDASGGGADLDFTPNNKWAIASLTPAGRDFFAGDMARLAIWQNITLPDITQAAARANFANATSGAIVNPATSVENYGTPVFDIYGDEAVWNAGTNQGSGGTMTMNGAVANA